MTVLCTYSLEKYGAAEILDVVNAHQFTIARRKGKWQMIETAVQMQALAEIKNLIKWLQRVKERSISHIFFWTMGLLLCLL